MPCRESARFMSARRCGALSEKQMTMTVTLSEALFSLLSRKPRLFPSMNFALPFAFLFASIGLNMVLKLIIPGPHLESVMNMHMSLRDLYSIIRHSGTAEEALQYSEKLHRHVSVTEILPFPTLNPPP